MIKHTQSQLYDPAKRKHGSCYPTAIACILNMDVEDVPNFYTLYHWEDKEEIVKERFRKAFPKVKEGETEDRKFWEYRSLWDTVINYWLVANGYKRSFIGLMEDGGESYQQWLKENPDRYYIASGKTVRGTDHVVIYKNGEMIWDPHPDRTGLETLEDIEFYDKLD